MQAGNGRGGRERRAGPTPGGGRGQLPQPRVNVPPAVPTNPAPQPPIPRRTGGIPRFLLHLSLLSIVLPLEGAVLGQIADTQPVAAAQQYGLTNAVQPSILAWCSPVGFFFILWKQPRQKLEAPTNMVPLNIHTNSVTPVALPPTIVTTEFHPTVNEGRVQLALEDHRAGVPLSPEELSQHEGGCRVDQLDGMNRRNQIIHGPSKAEERALARMTLNTA